MKHHLRVGGGRWGGVSGDFREGAGGKGGWYDNDETWRQQCYLSVDRS